MTPLKFFIVILTPFAFNLAWAAPIYPTKAIYKANKSNTEEVCDQAILPQYEGQESARKLRALKVYYVGHCGELGPYFYSCQSTRTQTHCGDGAIDFVWRTNNTYRWQNIPHGFVADFVLKKKLK